VVGVFSNSGSADFEVPGFSIFNPLVGYSRTYLDNDKRMGDFCNSNCVSGGGEEMKVIFDVDGVLANFSKGFHELTKKMYPKWEPLYPPNEAPFWDDYCAPLEPNKESEVWNAIKKSPSFWKMLEPLATDEEFGCIERLSYQCEVYFATHRVGTAVKEQTEIWLQRQGILRNTVIVTPLKGQVADAIKATHLIDDKAGNAIYTAYHSPSTKSYILDKPYNRFDHRIVGRRVIRVGNVAEFFSHLRQEKDWRE